MEGIVHRPKFVLQRPLFVQGDVRVAGQPEQRGIDDESPIAEQERLANNDPRTETYIGFRTYR